MKHTPNTLKIALVVSDNNSRLQLGNLAKNSGLAQVVADCTSAEHFLLSNHPNSFDLLLFDIENLGMRGKHFIKRCGDKHAIIIATDECLKEAIVCHPIDTLIKPLSNKHFVNALRKASFLINISSINRNLLEFNTTRGEGKRLLKPRDFVFVSTDEDESRNKILIMRNGEKHNLLNYSIPEIELMAPHLLRPNRNQLVCPEIITHRGYDHIYINILNNAAQPIMLTIGRDFSKQFKERLSQLLFVA